MRGRIGFPRSCGFFGAVATLSSLVFACTTFFASLPREPSFAGINDFFYQIRNVNLHELGRSRYDLVIIDSSRDGSDRGAWTALELETLKSAGEGRFVLAYLPAGEADSLRSYWQAAWGPGNPDWLGQEVSDKPEVHWVKFWHQEWRSLMKERLMAIVGQGFDGVYLAGVDAYEYWARPTAETGENESLPRVDSANRMIDFLRELAFYARETLGKDRFFLCPEGGTDILQDASLGRKDGFVQIIDAVVAEEVFFVGDWDTDNPYNPKETVLGDLDFLLGKGKLVFSVEYLSRTNRPSLDLFYEAARRRGFLPLGADRTLDSFRINPGYEPD